jgi:hypothetical protein
VLISFDQLVQRRWVDQSLLDEQRFECGDSKGYIGGNGAVGVVVI